MSDDPKRDALGALHEVSNALTVLLGWVAEARDPSATSEEVGHAMRIIEQRGRAARDIARRAIGARVSRSAEADADIDAVVTEVIETLAIEAQRAQVRVVPVNILVEPCRVPLGEDLAQIVTNLVLNALAHAPKGSELRIVTAIAPREVSIDVEDDGPGVASERTFSVFEGDSTRQGGAGVGLRHARAMARAAGGDLTLLPGDKTGATFRVTWLRDVPTVRPDALPQPGSKSFVDGGPQPPKPPNPPSRAKLQVLAGTRILIVEDDTDVTDLLETALRARGAEVTIARTALELAERIDAGHHAVLVDLSPIASDIAGALALVKREAQNAAIVFITGSAEALPEGMEGAAWLRKPFEVGDLVTILSQVSIKHP